MLSYNDWSTRLGAMRCRYFGTPDLNRWRDSGQFDWDERTQLIATLIPPASRVIEYGAGKRVLEQNLHPSCLYVPSDLISRGPGTIIVDLNARPLPEPPPQQFDFAVLAGVLEYVRDLPSLVPWLVRQAPLVIASYECAKSMPGSWGRMVENYMRSGAGWINNYSENELIHLFADAGLPRKHFIDWHSPDGTERIYQFGR